MNEMTQSCYLCDM